MPVILYSFLLGAELAQECTKMFNAQVQILVGESVTHNVEKWADINHAKKLFTSHLYSIQPQFKELSKKYIDHFTKCFGYALAQSKNDA